MLNRISTFDPIPTWTKIILTVMPARGIEAFWVALNPRLRRCLVTLGKRPGRFRKLGALQTMDSEEEIVGIRWISAIGRFHRTQGDGWPRTGGQVKHEGRRRCSGSGTKGIKLIQQQAVFQDWPAALRRRSTSISVKSVLRTKRVRFVLSFLPIGIEYVCLCGDYIFASDASSREQPVSEVLIPGDVSRRVHNKRSNCDVKYICESPTTNKFNRVSSMSDRFHLEDMMLSEISYGPLGRPGLAFNLFRTE